MAKKAMINRDLKRERLIQKYFEHRAALKKQLKDKSIPMNKRIALQMQLNKLPRDSSSSRYRNRCRLTGRPRGYYRLFQLSRIALRELGSSGQIVGLTKASW